MNFFDVRHPFFNPLWIRVALSVAVCGWALFELWMGSAFWAMLFGAAGIYLVWALLITWTPVETKGKGDG